MWATGPRGDTELAHIGAREGALRLRGEESAQARAPWAFPEQTLSGARWAAAPPAAGDGPWRKEDLAGGSERTSRPEDVPPRPEGPAGAREKRGGPRGQQVAQLAGARLPGTFGLGRWGRSDSCTCRTGDPRAVGCVLGNHDGNGVTRNPSYGFLVFS